MARTKYTIELWEALLDHLFTGGTVKEFARGHGITDRVVRKWSNKDDAHKAQYRQAMEAGADALLDEALVIVDDRTEDPASRRLRVWSRLEVAKSKAPHLYGNRALRGSALASPKPSGGTTRLDIDVRIEELLEKGNPDG